MPQKTRTRSLSRQSRASIRYREVLNMESEGLRLQRLETARARSLDARRSERLENQRETNRSTRLRERQEDRSHRFDNRRDLNIDTTEQGERLTLDPDYELHQTQTMYALKTGRKLGVIKDVLFFKESDFPQDLCHHELSSLYTANSVCPLCHAYRWKEERPGFCCANGKVSLPSLPPAPPELIQLL